MRRGRPVASVWNSVQNRASEGRPKLTSLWFARLSRGFQLVVHLVEKFALAFCAWPPHIPLVGLLRGDDFLISLLAKTLSGGDVRVMRH